MKIKKHTYCFILTIALVVMTLTKPFAQQSQWELKFNPFFLSPLNGGMAMGVEFYLKQRLGLELGAFASPGYYYVSSSSRRLPEVYTIRKLGLVVAPRMYFWGRQRGEGVLLGMNATVLPFGNITKANVPFTRDDKNRIEDAAAYTDIIFTGGIGYKRFFKRWSGEVAYNTPLLSNDPKNEKLVKPTYGGIVVKLGLSIR